MTRVLDTSFETALPSGFTTSVGSIALSSVQARSGTQSARCNLTSAGTGYLERTIYTGGGGEFAAYMRFYLFIATAPAVSCQIAAYGDSTNFTPNLHLETNRTLRMYNAAAAVGVASAAIPLAQWACVEFAYDDRNAGGPEGNNWSTLRLDGSTVSSVANANLAGFDRCRIGVQTSTTADLYFDDAAVNDYNAPENHWPGLIGGLEGSRHQSAMPAMFHR